MAPLFQIGEDKYSYNYSRTKMACNGAPIYKCCRGVAGAGSAPNDVLWLYRNYLEGRWIAILADADTDDPVNSGTPVFATAAKDIDDISVAQTVEWQWYERGDWRGSMRFTTYNFGGDGGDAAGGAGGAAASAAAGTTATAAAAAQESPGAGAGGRSS